jgi:alkanesulfonate monooxygenase SsuD/methylene tetrahydromethanopterin reductase-like flavin-dependent oxidoreductase (luciferase family)
MTNFRPTNAPAGRLVRLGIVLDLRNGPGRVRQLARMAEKAGVDVLWVRDYLVARDGAPRLEAWTALTLVGAETARVRLGAMLNVAYRHPAIVAAMVSALDLATEGRVELGLSSAVRPAEREAFGLGPPDGPGAERSVEQYAQIVRKLLAGERVTAVEPYGLHDAQLSRIGAQPGGPALTIEVTEESTDKEISHLAAVADNVLVTATPPERLDDGIELARSGIAAAGRDESTLGIAVQVPVSVGRTTAEALARAEAEPLFRYLGHPAESGIFGTLEQCHDRVVELAHAGVTELVCVLPNSPDVQDVIAQLTAAVIGTVEAFAPGAPRSVAPGPPEGWGGRPRFGG